MAKKLVLIALGGVAVVAACLTILMATSHATGQCPMDHKMSLNWYCKVTDQRNAEYLILHFNKKSGEVDLTITVPGTITRHLKHPFGKVSEFKDVSENVIKFGPEGLLINGEKYPEVTTNVYHNE